MNFNAAIFWASLSGWSGAVLVLLGVFLLFTLLEENEKVMGILFGGLMILSGLVGISVAMGITNGFEIT